MSPLPWVTIGRLAAAGFGAWVLIQTWQLWMLLLTALIVAAAILPAARLADRLRVPRLLTVAGVYLGAALVVGVLFRCLVPALVEQGTQFVRTLPGFVDQARAWLAQLVALGARWDITLTVPAAGDGDSLPKLGRILLENTLQATAGVIGAVVGFFLVFVLAAYIVIDAEGIGERLASMLPAAQRGRAAAIALRVLGVMGGYVRGQMIVSLVNGVAVAVGLAVLGVPYWLLIGGIAAGLNVVPFLGSPAAAVLGILAAFNISGWTALWTTLLFWGVNLMEGKLLIPFFVARATGLHPIAVMLAILVGAKLAGILGALVAIPLVAGAWEIVRSLYIEPTGEPAGG